MTDTEKILQMLGEMQKTVTTLQADVNAVKAELTALRPHVESKEEVAARRERLRKLLEESLNKKPTPEDIAEGDELLRNYREAKRNNAIAAAENAGLKVIYPDDNEQSTEGVIIDARKRVAS